MGKFIEMTGKKFGKLKVLGYYGKRNGRIYWHCVCDCGNEKNISGVNLRARRSTSCGCQGRKTKDRTGKRYGKLTAIEYSGRNKFNQALWKCKCDCGNITVVTGGALNHGDTKSCGCLHKFSKGQASRNAVLKKIKRQALQRGYEWNLPQDILEQLIIKPCFYCGALPSNECMNPSHNGSFMYNGLDRINNNTGYTKDNVVPCCWICNRAKGTLTIDEFFVWVKRIIRQKEATTKCIKREI